MHSLALSANAATAWRAVSNKCVCEVAELARVKCSPVVDVAVQRKCFSTFKMLFRRPEDQTNQQSFVKDTLMLP